jgi:hypothetical protein
MKYISDFTNFINEVINLPSDLNKNQRFQLGKPIDVALLTFQEYYNLINPRDEYHESNLWQYDLERMNDSPKNMSEMKVFQRKKIGNMDIVIYESTRKLQYGRRDENDVYHSLTDEEIKKAGLPAHEIGLTAFHEGKEIGFISDEWGATLVVVAKEYKGNGIGKLLTYLFRKKHPDRESGGFSEAGYKNIINIHREFVKEYLRNGVYSHLVKKGELTKERAKEIIASAKLQDYKPNKITDFAKKYNVSELTEDLLFWRFSDTDFILFDKNILNHYKEDDNDQVVEHYLKGHVYLSYNTLFNSYELYESYGISKKFEAMLLHVAFETVKKEEDEGVIIRITNDLSPQTLEIIEKFKTNGEFEVTKVKDYSYDILKIKNAHDYTPIFKKAELFIKKNDKYDEFSNYLSELAYSMSHYKGKEVF